MINTSCGVSCWHSAHKARISPASCSTRSSCSLLNGPSQTDRVPPDMRHVQTTRRGDVKSTRHSRLHSPEQYAG